MQPVHVSFSSHALLAPTPRLVLHHVVATDGPLAQCKAYEGQINELQNLVKFYERKITTMAEAGLGGLEVRAGRVCVRACLPGLLLCAQGLLGVRLGRHMEMTRDRGSGCVSAGSPGCGTLAYLLRTRHCPAAPQALGGPGNQPGPDDWVLEEFWHNDEMYLLDRKTGKMFTVPGDNNFPRPLGERRGGGRKGRELACMWGLRTSESCLACDGDLRV